MIRVVYFSYSGNHANGQDSTNHLLIKPSHAQEALALKEEFAHAQKIAIRKNGVTVEVPKPAIKILSRDNFGTRYEIKWSAKSWRRATGAHV